MRPTEGEGLLDLRLICNVITTNHVSTAKRLAIKNDEFTFKTRFSNHECEMMIVFIQLVQAPA